MRTTDFLIEAIRLPEPAASRWHRAGIAPRTERLFDVLAGVIVFFFATGWTWSVANARAGGDEGMTSSTASIASALTDVHAPSAAFLTSAAMEALTPLRGVSGSLRVQFQQPGQPLPVDTLPPGTGLEFQPLDNDDRMDLPADVAGPPVAGRPGPGAPADATVPATVPAEKTAASSTLAAPGRAGIWQLAIRAGAFIKPITDFNIITLRPFSDKNRGRIGLYYLGTWPYEKRRSSAPRYRPPSGFIEVTPANQDTWVSDHFRLRDFLTKDQPRVWPKYLVLDVKLLDKLELVLQELESRGISTDSVRVLSGFRTPNYNERGGDPRGRAALSRHMYGDAADIYLDSNGDGRMDDLNRDRRVNIRDSRVMEQAVSAVERRYPALVGGTGVYPGTGAHGPFIHIDTRGYRARWTGTRDSQ